MSRVIHVAERVLHQVTFAGRFATECQLSSEPVTSNRQPSQTLGGGVSAR